MNKTSLISSFFQNNRKNLVQNLLEKSIAIINSANELNRNGDQNFAFRQNSDFFYLTGLEQEKCVLVLSPQHPDKNLKEVIFTLQPNDLMETWTGHKYTADEISEISGIKTVKWLDQFDMLVREMILSSENIYLNLNEYTKYLPELVYNDYKLVSKLKEQFPLHLYHRLAPLITSQRLVKNEEEIKLIQKACTITNSAFKRILKFLHPGVKEYEVEAEMIHEFIINGARGHAYQPIVASGKNGLVLHYTENKDECRDGDLLLMDFGAECENYAADCSRTIPVNGKFTARQKDCYNAVLRVQKKAIPLFVPGNTIDNINREVWKMMEEEMISLKLFSKHDVANQNPKKPLYSSYLMHGVAHFIGLDVHDVGNKYEKFKRGMVLTIEPGLYIREEGIGIRIENNIMVDDVPVDLTAEIPREVEEIEDLMKK
ncbi:MAG: aminopeptidase P N-terminal domain-containing protein [Bacteroidales bacterium]|nr:aminopeptidase P N-terminal domain-containing protein [Bacteroidales bacterium]MCF8405006.1 aminopeptidase P N-terminal domain-containing protein [Bacteroidales bacterium]